MRPSEVESPMCTTDRHAVRRPPVAAGAGLADVLGACLRTAAGEAAGMVPGAGLADGRTPPARPQLASATTPTDATTVSQVRRPAALSRHPADLAWASHRPMAPWRTGSSTNRHDSAATPKAAATCRAPRARLSRPLTGVVSTMIG